MNDGMNRIILSVLQNIVMDMNNIMSTNFEENGYIYGLNFANHFALSVCVSYHTIMKWVHS